MDKFVVGITRPTVLIENNFELIMLIMLYYFINIIKRAGYDKYWDDDVNLCHFRFAIIIVSFNDCNTIFSG